MSRNSFPFGPPCAAALGGLLLSACQSQAEPLSKDEILARAASLTAPEPGYYTTTTALSDFELPGTSPQEAERMRQRFGALEPQVVEGCLGEEDAARGFMALVEAMQDGACAFSRFDADETWLQAEMRCEVADGTMSDVTMLGEAGTQASRLQADVVQRGPGLPGGEQRFTLTVETERQGACTTDPPEG